MKKSWVAAFDYKSDKLHLPCSTTLVKGTILPVLTFISWCNILHTHLFLAACQVPHFEPAGIDGIFITSNPFVIMAESHSRYEKFFALSVGKSLISDPSLSSLSLFSQKVCVPSACVVSESLYAIKAFYPFSRHTFPSVLNLHDN